MSEKLMKEIAKVQEDQDKKFQKIMNQANEYHKKNFPSISCGDCDEDDEQAKGARDEYEKQVLALKM